MKNLTGAGNAFQRAETWRLHWGAIFGGAAIAVAIGWIGELFGGLFTLFRPGTSGVWSWLGGLLNVIFWAGAEVGMRGVG